MSWKPEVQTGNDKNWYDNRVCFATKEEAEYSARDLMNRWTLVTACRAIESDEPVNYVLDVKTGEMRRVAEESTLDPQT